MKLLTHKAIAGADWQLKPAADNDCVLVLETGGRELLRWRGVRLNAHDEADALNRKFRYHSTVDQLSAELDMASVVPFGGEPGFRRQLTVCDSLLRERLDFAPGVNEALREIAPARFQLPGKWTEVALTPIPPLGESIAVAPFQACKPGLVATQKTPWLTLMARREDGAMVEIGLGDDLWRWCAAGDYPGDSGEFRLECSADGALEVSFKVFNLDKELELQRRPWRFGFYVAWRAGVEPAKIEAETRFNLAEAEQPAAAHRLGELNRRSEHCCAQASTVQRALRKAARTQNTHLSVTGMLPGVCADAAHLERVNQKLRTHWDYSVIQELHLWGNRMLGGSGSLSWSWADAAFADTPAARKLARPAVGGIEVVAIKPER